jgi:hypothetical protein
MIPGHHAEEVRRGPQPIGERQVIFTGSWHATRVRVNEDDAVGSATDGLLQGIARVDRAGIFGT